MESEKKKLNVSISGMHCASCVRRVESAIGSLPGVDSAVVNLATEKGTIEFDPERIDPETIIRRIESSGYQATETGEKRRPNDPDPVEKKLRESEDLKKRFIFAIISAVIASVLSMPHLFPFVNLIPEFPRHIILMLIASSVMFLAGSGFYTGALKSARQMTADMNTLVAVGTLSAFIYSVSATFYPQFFISAGYAHPPVYYETSVMIITLILLGRMLEARARAKTSSAIMQLMELQPDKAHLVRDEGILDIPADDVKEGDILQVLPGEKIPVDGVIISGNTALDESTITGESIPADRKPGDRIYGATLNTWGAIRFRAEKVGKDTVLSQIMKIVEEAQTRKAPIQRIADLIASYFVPVVIIIAITVFFLWLFLSPAPSLSMAIMNFISVLIIACPCAMGLATPTAIMVGVGRGAQMGILFRGGESLETIRKIDTVVMDKTGTLTLGKPEVTGVYPVNADEEELISITSSLESLSEHPLARAILEKAKKMGLEISDVSDFKSSPGKGVSGVIKGRKALAGRKDFISDAEIDISPVLSTAEALEQEGKTLIFTAFDGKTIGVTALSDIPRATSPGAVAELKEMGMEVIMLTGDSPATARAMAELVGIERVIAGVLPTEKSEIIEKLKREGRTVAMAGDGINDAPALTVAHVGIAMGTGSDVARSASDITIVGDDPMKVASAIKLGREVVKTIYQNFFWAFIYNVTGIPIAGGALYPAFRILLQPVIASTAMAFSSVSVVTNSLRLKNRKL